MDVEFLRRAWPRRPDAARRRRLKALGALAAIAMALPAGAVRVGRTVDPAVAARLFAQRALAVRTMPDVRHLSCNEAQRRLEAALHASSVPCEEGDALAGFAPGSVNRQEPAPGPLARNATPSVRIFTQPPAPPPAPLPRLVVAPQLHDVPEEQARRVLAAPPFAAIRPVFVDEPRAAEGRRVDTEDPPAGTRLAPGSTLTITFGLSVPYLKDLPCNEATARGAAHGFTVSCNPIEVDVGDARDGLVQGQSPVPSDRLLARAEPMSVDVALARIAAPAPPAAPPQPSPPSLVEVPDVTNDDEATAMSLIAHVGLKPVMAPARRGRDWLVEGERPPAGTMVVAGSRVVLQAVRAVKVPQLRGLRVGDARSELERLRLVARPDSDGAERRVTDQSPAAETIVAKGTDVALTTTAPPASLVDGLLSSFDDWRVRLSPGGWGAVIGTVLVASGILLRRILRRKVESSPSPPPSSPPPGPTSPPIDVRWHAQPDLSPLVWMRLASRADSGDSRRLAPEWRVEADDGIALLRAATPETGVSNVDD